MTVSDPVSIWKKSSLADMSPAYFGLVMATGVVSIAAHLLGYSPISLALFYLNIVQFGALSVLYIVRAWRYPRRFFGDMISHASGPGYFTIVAGLNVLAGQFLILGKSSSVAMVLWALAIVLWVLLTYTIFTALTVRHNKPTLEKGISGGWLLAVVATQSLAVTSELLAERIDQPDRIELNLLALSMWLWGGMLYIWLISLIFYRYTFFRFSPGDLLPPYWINMGAMAISTLAGAQLILSAQHAPFLMSLLPFLKGFTIFYWATGTWWIPMLFLLGLWRYGYERFPFTYDPLYWGAVFPLGMYAACTWQLNHAMGFDFLWFLPRVFFAIALVAWSVTFAGMLRSLIRGWKGTST